VVQRLPTIKDPATRDAKYTEAIAIIQRLLGADRATQLVAQPALALFAPHPPTSDEVVEARARLGDCERKIAETQTESATAAEREQARDIARDSLGLFGFAFVVLNQELMLSDDQSESALDSELALLWWHFYPRARWVNNPLEWRSQVRSRRMRQPFSHTLDIVRNIILTSVKVEAVGLHGQVAIDARGKTGGDPYSEYDQRLRNLADLLSKKTTLKVTLENTEALIPPHSLPDIAVYCGWYSLRSFSSPGSFSPGAIGFHIASLECVSLRQPREHGWVRGLLSEGVVGTEGPVAEPFLQSFPPADEFFPLMMTGKLTLAEAYWRTLPWASWMQLCIGDPLYNPYKNDPALNVEDLPGQLREAVEEAPDSPATQPISPAVR